MVTPIGRPVVCLMAVRGSALEIEDVDVLDGTPVPDAKPVVPVVGLPCGDLWVGWLEGRSEGVAVARADGRFHDGE